VFDRMSVTVEVHEEPTTHTVKMERLKQWIKSQGRHPREQTKKEELRKLLYIWVEVGGRWKKFTGHSRS
jgi:hypothetical protein